MSRLPSPAPLPWRRPRHELLLLALVAVVALASIYPPGAEDISRMCLTRALLHGRISNDECLLQTGDRSSYGGHLYTNTAPGVSALAVPAAAVVRLRDPSRWSASGDTRLWVVRLSVSGLALLAAAFLVGRVAEGIAAGWGGATLVTFALGTIAAASGPTSFDHLPAAALGFGAFVLAWARRPLAAGLAAGVAVVVEYQAGLIAAIVGAYVLLAGARALGRYALGLVPGAVLLGAYDWAAFGSPFHLSYRYGTSVWAGEHARGFFGIHLPTAHGTHLVLAGNRGLLLVSPVLVAAAYGLFLLRGRGLRAELWVCAAVTLVFVLLDCGYFLPYGGDSPGPRFVIPALPFLALGLPLVFVRWPAPVAALAAVSVVASTAIALTWPTAVNSVTGYRGSVWREFGDVVAHGSSAQIATWVQKNALTWLGPGRLGAAAIVLALALAALAIGLRSGWTARRAEPRPAS